MQQKSWFIGFFLGLGCQSNTPAHIHTETLSVQQHKKQATDHETQALAAESAGRELPLGPQAECLDDGIPLLIGTEKVRVMAPCWTQAENSVAYKRLADEQRSAAADHRRWAQELMDVEKKACRTVDRGENFISPFAHSPDILSVAEYRKSGTLRGARVTFRKVKGLTPSWLAASIRCHQARAAVLGFPSSYMDHCPLSIGHITAEFTETPDTIVVTLHSPDDLVAVGVYGRAARAVAINANKHETIP